MKKKIFFITIALFTVIFLAAALLYRKHLTHWMVEKYFAEKNIKIQFDVDSFNFSGISLSHILLEDRIKIERVNLQFNSSNFNPMNIKSFSVHMKVFDFKEISEIMAKFSEPTPPGASLQFSELSGICDKVHPLALDIQIDSFLLNDQKTPLGLRVTHLAKDPKTLFEVKGYLETSPAPNLVSFKKWAYAASSFVECQKEQIKVTVSSLQSQLTQAQLDKKDLSIKSMDFSITEGFITVSKQSIAFNLPNRMKIRAKKKDLNIQAQWANAQIQGETKLNELTKGALKLKIKGFSLSQPKKVSIDSLNLEFKKKGALLFPLTGHFEVKQLKYSDEAEQPLLQGIQVHGRFELKENIYSSSLNLTDASETLNFKNGQLLHDPKNQKIKVILNQKNSWIKLSSQLSSLSPPLSKMELQGEGKIQVRGHMSLLNKGLKGNLKFSAKNIDMESKFGSFKGMSFEHNILGYPSLASSKGQQFRAKELTYGPTFSDLNIKYQINNLSQINVDLMEVEVKKAQVHAANFSVNALSKTATNFKAQIYQLPVEDLLKMALGDSITAQGSLDGQLTLSFVDKKPIAKGLLKTPQKGWLGYRKTGTQQTNFKDVTISNMGIDILEGYLYDFYYDSLGIDIITDQDFNMKMTLRILGKNPQYLDGRPLKLNINLEQNLLAAFKAMMLTYNLPDRIKDKIEQMGTK